LARKHPCEQRPAISARRARALFRCLPVWEKEAKSRLDLGYHGPDRAFALGPCIAWRFPGVGDIVVEGPALRWSVADPRPGWRRMMDRGS
jgi:hypothetical protein